MTWNDGVLPNKSTHDDKVQLRLYPLLLPIPKKLEMHHLTDQSDTDSKYLNVL